MKLSHPSPWQQSLAAAKANLLPGLALQSLAAALVFAYYFSPRAHEIFEAVAVIKSQWGWRFSMVSTGIFGGVIPYLYLRLHPRSRSATPFTHGLFYVLFWTYKGLEVDTLYRFQAWLFGADHAASTLVCKIAFDQFVYNPLWSAPMSLFFFHWKENGFSLLSLRRTSWPAYWRSALPAGLMSTWSVWVPTVAIIYSLPSSLQVPLFNVVLCFWVLLLTTLTRRPREAEHGYASSPQ